MNQLLTFIQTLHPTSSDVIAALGKILRCETLPRKHWLLQPGQVSDRIYFIPEPQRIPVNLWVR